MSDKNSNINDTIRTLIRGIVGTIIVLGFFYLLFNSSNFSDYEVCLRKCPKVSWSDDSFADLECPKMCAELNKKYCLKEGIEDLYNKGKGVTFPSDFVTC